MSNEIPIPSYLDKGFITPIRGTLEGAWRLRDLMEYKGAYRGWCTPENKLWGPRDYLFEAAFLTIFRPDETLSMPYTFMPSNRTLVIDDETCFVSDLTRRELVLHCGVRQYTFERIDPCAVENRPPYVVTDEEKFRGLWWIDARYQLVKGEWRLQEDFRREPGMVFWNVRNLPYWDRSAFGKAPDNQGGSYSTYNERFSIVRQSLPANQSLFYHLSKEEGAFWAYELGSLAGDYRETRTRLRMTPVDLSQADGYVRSLYWAESERHHPTPLDKMPLELLRLWAGVDVGMMERLIKGNELFEQPEKYRTEEYAGFYVFLHYYTISNKDYDAALMAKAYRQFHEVLSRWLELYDAGKTVKLIYPFKFKKNKDHLAALRKAAASSDEKYIDFQLVTCEMLRKRIEEIRSNDADHYLYTLMEGLPKEAFYIRLENELSRKEEWAKSNFTLQEFEKAAKNLKPDDPVSLNFFLHRNTTKTIYVSNWILYSNSIDRVSEFSTENLKRVFDAFLAAYCEKSLRLNGLFQMSPETIRRFRFTEADIRELTPRLDRFNEEAMGRIREDYEALARLDFIRAEIMNQT